MIAPANRSTADSAVLSRSDMLEGSGHVLELQQNPRSTQSNPEALKEP